MALLLIMISSWADSDSESIWLGYFVRNLPNDIQRIAKRKLVHIHAAKTIDDLRVPPGNRLEKLQGDRKDFWSIRINEQWRICFRWESGNAFEVQIVDYH
jgi:proteic killer suppression protein